MKPRKYLKPLGGEGVTVFAVNLRDGERRAWAEPALPEEGRVAIGALRRVVAELQDMNRSGATWRIDVISTPSSIHRELDGTRQENQGGSSWTNAPEATLLGLVQATDLLLHAPSSGQRLDW
jgi:hypothetical protein